MKPDFSLPAIFVLRRLMECIGPCLEQANDFNYRFCIAKYVYTYAVRRFLSKLFARRRMHAQLNIGFAQFNRL